MYPRPRENLSIATQKTAGNVRQISQRLKKLSDEVLMLERQAKELDELRLALEPHAIDPGLVRTKLRWARESIDHTIDKLADALWRLDRFTEHILAHSEQQDQADLNARYATPKTAEPSIQT